MTEDEKNRDESWRRVVRHKHEKEHDEKHSTDVERQPHNLQAIIIRILVDPEFLDKLIEARSKPDTVGKIRAIMDANHYLTGLSEAEIVPIISKIAQLKWEELQNLPIRQIRKAILSELGIKSRYKSIIIDSWLLDV